MDNALNRNIIIGLYNDIFDHRQGNTIIYYIISIFLYRVKDINTIWWYIVKIIHELKLKDDHHLIQHIMQVHS